MKRLSTLAAITLSFFVGSAAIADGNLASKPTNLEKLVVDKSLNMSTKEYQLKTGKYYKWTIESEGGDEILIFAPELFRNSWINQIVIEDIEVKPMGGIYGVEFDSAGTADVFFVPVRTGDFEFSIKGHEARGLVGKFVVR